MFPQVIQINRRVDATDQYLDFLLIEHPKEICINAMSHIGPLWGIAPKPLGINQFGKSFKERVALAFDLFTKTVMGY